MKTRKTNLNVIALLACPLLITLLMAGGLRAEDLPTETQVALRPGSIPASTRPMLNAPAPTAPGFFGDQYQPDMMDGPPKPTPEQDEQLEISSRYSDSRMIAFLRNTTINQMMSLYNEAAQMIDSRHVNPLSYEERTRQAVNHLEAALENPEFLQAAGFRGNNQSIATLKQELNQLNASPARSASEALGVMQWAAELANRRLGLSREAVALEFFNGTLDSLDKYSAFVPAKTGFGPSAILEEQMVGIGVELKTHESGALINDVLENSPALEGGLKGGDVITGIDGKSVAGQSLGQIADQIGGPTGTSVTLQIEREGRRYTVSLRRRSVYVSSVSGVRMLTADTGYLRLKQFSESSAEDMEKAMWTMYEQGMRNIVLDLRGNPGGLLTEAIQVSNLFVPNGRIVATRGRTEQDNSDSRATFEKTWRLPLVVLIDENSASASEIFAAAIQENGRGLIVGNHSYGKGTVQTHFPLRTVSGDLKLTTAKFYSPAGREMAGAGVTPDVKAAGGRPGSDLAQDPVIAAAMHEMQGGAPARLASSAGQRP